MQIQLVQISRFWAYLGSGLWCLGVRFISNTVVGHTSSLCDAKIRWYFTNSRYTRACLSALKFFINKLCPVAFPWSSSTLRKEDWIENHFSWCSVQILECPRFQVCFHYWFFTRHKQFFLRNSMLNFSFHVLMGQFESCVASLHLKILDSVLRVCILKIQIKNTTNLNSSFEVPAGGSPNHWLNFWLHGPKLQLFGFNRLLESQISFFFWGCNSW